jgi:hypothetical protein
MLTLLIDGINPLPSFWPAESVHHPPIGGKKLRRIN